jgi:hypothetical protein
MGDEAEVREATETIRPSSPLGGDGTFREQPDASNDHSVSFSHIPVVTRSSYLTNVSWIGWPD